jgi:pyridinium-3,5-bisthiocarboxylic acid mononucleotide nickel chelatase
VHLDLVGGLAGDMFIAALLDAFPIYESKVLEAIRAASTEVPVACALIPFKDDVLQGRQFHVSSIPGARARIPFVPMARAHSHTSWADIRSRLEKAALPSALIGHALQIFKLLADAEAWVHGIEVESVSFHEVGAWDSIADIVGAAALIEALGVTHWSSSPVPLGSGRVMTAHGVLPVPAPATARLLTGMTTVDDGVPGERITPTGAAILRYLCPPTEARAAQSRIRKLVACGTGFGSRALPRLSNHVRVMCFEPVAEALSPRRIEVLEFEIDDQSPEDLAAGLDRLRGHPGVLDVTQAPVFGKKGRMMMHVQVLARATEVEAVIESCFRETTTLGLRVRAVQGVGLERRTHDVDIDGQRLRVKIAKRPGGRTAKTESDDVLSHSNHARRAALRRRAESEALKIEQLSDA